MLKVSPGKYRRSAMTVLVVVVVVAVVVVVVVVVVESFQRIYSNADAAMQYKFALIVHTLQL